MTLRDLRAIDAMTYHGGHFVRALAHAAAAADPENLERIKKTWPEIWERYATWPQPMEPHP